MSSAPTTEDDRSDLPAEAAVVGAGAGTDRGASFSELFSRALRGEPCTVLGLDGQPRPLPVSSWLRDADAADRTLTSRCQGPTIDIGCGPGRLTAHLARTGRMALGIDVVREAVEQTRIRGGSALLRDVFDDLPGEGRWRSALLADGNIGIGGDPQALLERVRQLLTPDGAAVVEVERPGSGTATGWATLQCGSSRSRPFRWAHVGVEALADLAAPAGMTVRQTHRHGDRWWSVLTRSP